MAINYNDHMGNKKKEDVAPFTAEELIYINEVENFIDGEIKRRIDTNNKTVSIFLGIPKFKIRVDGKSQYPYMTNARLNLLFEELMRRYDEAGWTYTLHIDDGLDGPNRSGDDYLILKGK